MSRTMWTGTQSGHDRRPPSRGAVFACAFGGMLTGLQACAAPATSTPVPVVDAERTAQVAAENSRFQHPTRVDFEWSLVDRSLKVEGVGVARLDSDKARLDLFLRNGANVISVVLVEDEVRVPPGQMFDVLPDRALLWAALGIFRLDPSMTLLGGESLGGEAVRLRYRLDDGKELRYQIESGRVGRVELLEEGHVVHQVVLARDQGAEHPREAVYRHMSAFREMRVQIDSVKDVHAFPTDIWDPRR